MHYFINPVFWRHNYQSGPVSSFTSVQDYLSCVGTGLCGVMWDNTAKKKGGGGIVKSAHQPLLEADISLYLSVTLHHL